LRLKNGEIKEVSEEKGEAESCSGSGEVRLLTSGA
jgi:hypothetical protein